MSTREWVSGLLISPRPDFGNAMNAVNAREGLKDTAITPPCGSAIPCGRARSTTSTGHAWLVLREAGVGPDDRVPVIMPKCPEVLAAFQAVWKLGAASPITPQCCAKEVGMCSIHSDAKVVGRFGPASRSADRCQRQAALQGVSILTNNAPGESGKARIVGQGSGVADGSAGAASSKCESSSTRAKRP